MANRFLKRQRRAVDAENRSHTLSVFVARIVGQAARKGKHGDVRKLRAPRDTDYDLATQALPVEFSFAGEHQISVTQTLFKANDIQNGFDSHLKFTAEERYSAAAHTANRASPAHFQNIDTKVSAHNGGRGHPCTEREGGGIVLQLQ